MKTAARKAKGHLNTRASRKKDFRFRRFSVSGIFGFFRGDTSGAVYWELVGQEPACQGNLRTLPSILIFEEGQWSRIVGGLQGKLFSFLKVRGQVFGVKFKPGALLPPI